MENQETIRDFLTPSQRALALNHTIDPGFINHRRIETILGSSGMAVIDDLISKLPDLPEWQRKERINRIYSKVMLWFCEVNKIRTLQDVLASRNGRLVCSTEVFGPCPDVYDSQRAANSWVPPGESELMVEIHYSTRHIFSDTMRMELHDGATISVIAEFHSLDGKTIIFRPLVMGAPWLEAGDEEPDFDIMWHGFDFFENFIEDFDEFSKVQEIPTPASPELMQNISESSFKSCLAKILGDSMQKDWGGEASDFFSAHLHLGGRRVTAAFLLKGPAKFSPMTLNHLGKNNDQIVRLAHEPAQVLFVQHAHDILPPVRETLRAFAVQPSNPRRYCLMDGRDSLRLLYAYELFDWAVENS